MAQSFLFNLIDKACAEYHMINDGDKILVGASGGKDSTALIEYLANRSRRKNCNFEFTALTVQSDFAHPFPSKVLSLFEEWKIDHKIIDVDILARLKEGHKMSCYWCSTQRRTELINYALKNGYNCIALGHHMDDILETLLMNALGHGVFRTMPPVLKYDKYPVSIIRPLCYASEKTIIEHGKEKGYLGFTCTCNYQANSERKEARKRLELLTGGDEKLKDHLYKSLKNIETKYLP